MLGLNQLVRCTTTPSRPTQSGPASVSINPTSSNYSIEVPLNDGDQIVFEYKPLRRKY